LHYGAEIDFVIETRKRQPSSVPHIVCIEVKLADKWKHSWERPMRSLQSCTTIEVDRMIGVYTGQRTYHFNGLDVLPVEKFLKSLYQGDIF